MAVRNVMAAGVGRFQMSDHSEVLIVNRQQVTCESTKKIRITQRITNYWSVLHYRNYDSVSYFYYNHVHTSTILSLYYDLTTNMIRERFFAPYCIQQSALVQK